MPVPSPAQAMGDARPTGSTGRPLSGAALRAGMMPAVCQALIQLASRVSNLPGPDALRAIVGREAAVSILYGAGKGDLVERVEEDFQAEQARHCQITVSGALDYNRDPSHDHRVVDLILKGANTETINAMIQAVAAEMAAVPRPVVGPGGPYGDEPNRHQQVMGVTYDSKGTPQQTSRPTGPDWDHYPDHQTAVRHPFMHMHPDAEARLKPQPESVWAESPAPDCSHEGEKAGKHCSQCGLILPEGDQQ